MYDIEYLTDKTGKPKAVVVPIKFWKQFLSGNESSKEKLLEELEEYCLDKAMDEAKNTPLLGRKEALEYLEK